MATQVSTLVYALDAGRLALLHRRRPPNAGLWSPPGGKVAPGESPLDGALRELAEETGLIGLAPSLAGVVSELDEETGAAWLMFLVRVAVADPALGGDGREGPVAWVALDEVPALPQPPADAHYLAAVLDPAPGVAFFTARYRSGVLLALGARRAEAGSGPMA